MIRALLDCPGSLTEILATSEGSQVLLDFDSLLKDEGLDPVPFLTPEEHIAWRVNPPSGLRTARGAIERLLMRIVRWEGGTCQAIPTSGPRDFSTIWKCGLRDAMSLTNDWRSPQIIFPASRRRDWANKSEVDIQIEACGEIAPSGPHNRLIAELEAYSDHPHAKSDADPWNLRHTLSTQPINCNKNPCMLPKPPELRYVDLEDIPARLNGVNRSEKDKWYYIPPSNWDANSISKTSWRRGRAFPYGEKNGRSGWIDERQFVWHWDLDHVSGHWDVQLDNGGHVNVSHTGEVFR
jgi:hypothetical protein